VVSTEVNRKSQVADRYVSVPMILSDLERQDIMVKFFRQISLITLVPFDQNDQIQQGDTGGRAVYFCGHRRLYRKGAGPKRSPILGVPFYLYIHPDAELPNFTC